MNTAPTVRSASGLYSVKSSPTGRVTLWRCRGPVRSGRYGALRLRTSRDRSLCVAAEGKDDKHQGLGETGRGLEGCRGMYHNGRNSGSRRRDRSSIVSRAGFEALESVLEVQLSRTNLQRMYEREEEEALAQHLNSVADKVRQMVEDKRTEIWRRRLIAGDLAPTRKTLCRSCDGGSTRRLKVPKVRRASYSQRTF